MSLRVVSYGGGVQSTALLVLAAQGVIDFPLFVFANVGADSENPHTLDYLETTARPYAAQHGIELHEVQKRLRDGSPDTIIRWVDRTQSSVPIPARMGNGAPGNRTCTQNFKIQVIDKELKRRGATAAQPALVALGISLDEYQRMRSGSGKAYKTLAYPLIDARLTRQDCIRVIARASLPVPPKSSCYFCPFHRMREWRRQARDEPDLFAKSVALEVRLNDRRAALGKDAVWLTRYARPLDQVVGQHDQLDLFADAGCDIAGYCHV